MRSFQQRGPSQVTKEQADELSRPAARSVQTTIRGGRAGTLAHDAIVHLQRMAGNTGVTSLLSVQRGRNKGGTAVKPKASDAVDKEVAALETALKKYDADDELNGDDGYKFQRSLSQAAGLPFKGHPPHGANFNKKQTVEAVVQNWWDGLHPNTRTRFRPALDAAFGAGKF